MKGTYSKARAFLEEVWHDEACRQFAAGNMRVTDEYQTDQIIK